MVHIGSARLMVNSHNFNEVGLCIGLTRYDSKIRLSCEEATIKRAEKTTKIIEAVQVFRACRWD